MVTKDMREKVGMLQAASIGYCFGGTLFEKAVWQRRLDAYIALCREFSCPAVEVSDGTIELPRADKIARIRQLKREGFLVLSEVGHKDVARSLTMVARQWIEAIGEELEAGANYVVLEARAASATAMASCAWMFWKRLSPPEYRFSAWCSKRRARRCRRS